MYGVVQSINTDASALVLSYGVATGGLTAIIMNLLLPKRGGVQA
ncbi:hypothetical protein [Aeromonas rivipollensis]